MTPDVNVLVAASRSDHPHHDAALAWLEAALDEAARGQTVAVLPMVGVSFLRLVTNPRVFVHPTPIGDAWVFLRAVLGCPGVEMPSLGPEWPFLERLCEQYGLVGNDITDAWIAAAVTANHDHLVSFDRGFRRWLTAAQFTLLQPSTRRS